MRIKDETKRLAIINTTIDVVFKEGFAGVKMASLAKNVGISVSTLYVYFKNKEDLLVTIAIELFQRETLRTKQEIDKTLPFKLKLKAMWLYWVNFSINYSKEMNFIMRIKQSPYYEKIPKAIIDTKQRLGKDLFDKGKTEGLLKNIDNDILESVMGALLMETVTLILKEKIKLTKKDTDLMFSIAWDSIKS